MTSGEFSYIQDLLQVHTGIVLEPGKEYLAESRLMPLAKLEGFGSLTEMIARLRAGSPNGLHRQVIEAMTTNETSFFRDFPAFESLRKRVLPELIGRRSAERRLTLWCAACSSGQEPYSVAMLLKDGFPEIASWTTTILASDLSEAMLERARAGRFTQIEVNRGLPAALLVKHFVKQGLDWEIRKELREAVQFRRINLAEPWPALPPVDLILMRNVLIYLGEETRKAVLGRARQLLPEDGYLFLGGAESTYGTDDAFARVDLDGAAFYRLQGVRR